MKIKSCTDKSQLKAIKEKTIFTNEIGFQINRLFFDLEILEEESVGRFLLRDVVTVEENLF